MCFSLDLKPIVKEREGGAGRGRFRRRARKCFKKEVYRLRGIGEGVFSAIEVKYGAKIRAKKEKTRQVAAFMLAAAFNISATLRAIAMMFAEIKGMKAQKACLLVGFIRQPRLNGNQGNPLI